MVDKNRTQTRFGRHALSGDWWACNRSVRMLQECGMDRRSESKDPVITAAFSSARQRSVITGLRFGVFRLNPFNASAQYLVAYSKHSKCVDDHCGQGIAQVAQIHCQVLHDNCMVQMLLLYILMIHLAIAVVLLLYCRGSGSSTLVREFASKRS